MTNLNILVNMCLIVEKYDIEPMKRILCLSSAQYDEPEKIYESIQIRTITLTNKGWDVKKTL